MTARHVYVSVRREAVDVIPLDEDGRRHLTDGHLRPPLQHLGEAALVGGRRVKHDGEGEAAVRGHALEETHQRLYAARRRADADEHQAVTLFALSLSHKVTRPPSQNGCRFDLRLPAALSSGLVSACAAACCSLENESLVQPYTYVQRRRRAVCFTRGRVINASDFQSPSVENFSLLTPSRAAQKMPDA